MWGPTQNGYCQLGTANELTQEQDCLDHGGMVGRKSHHRANDEVMSGSVRLTEDGYVKPPVSLPFVFVLSGKTQKCGGGDSLGRSPSRMYKM